MGSWAIGILSVKAHAMSLSQARADGDPTEGMPIGQEDPLAARGWLFLDFFNEPGGLIPLLVEMSFI